MSLWTKFDEFFEARDRRQRIIIAVCGLGVIFLAFDLLLFQSFSKQEEALDQRFNKANTELSKTSAQEKVFAKALSDNPNAAVQRELVQLQDELIRLDNELRELSVGLVAPENLPLILRDVIRHEPKLQLLAMTTLAPEPVALSTSVTESSAEETESEIEQAQSENLIQSAQVYRHSVQLLVRGRYFDIAKYLQDLEAQEWKFYWSELDYKVENYPHAEVLIEVYTLSSGEGGFGA
jgi:MSHA biogenesis protein MshJ